MSLPTEIFPKFYGGMFVEETFKSVKILGDATRVVSSPATKIWESWNRRNPQTGMPEGAMAVMKDRMLKMLFLRSRKSLYPYRTRLA